MSNTFWAVFLGSFLGLASFELFVSVLDDYRAKKRQKNLMLLLEELEDFEADDEDVE